MEWPLGLIRFLKRIYSNLKFRVQLSRFSFLLKLAIRWNFIEPSFFFFFFQICSAVWFAYRRFCRQKIVRLSDFLIKSSNFFCRAEKIETNLRNVSMVFTRKTARFLIKKKSGRRWESDRIKCEKVIIGTRQNSRNDKDKIRSSVFLPFLCNFAGDSRNHQGGICTLTVRAKECSNTRS